MLPIKTGTPGRTLSLFEKCTGFFYMHYTTHGTNSFNSHQMVNREVIHLEAVHKYAGREGGKCVPYAFIFYRHVKLFLVLHICLRFIHSSHVSLVDPGSIPPCGLSFSVPTWLHKFSQKGFSSNNQNWNYFIVFLTKSWCDVSPRNALPTKQFRFRYNTWTLSSSSLFHCRRKSLFTNSPFHSTLCRLLRSNAPIYTYFICPSYGHWHPNGATYLRDDWFKWNLSVGI